jgi:hypothetical protein
MYHKILFTVLHATLEPLHKFVESLQPISYEYKGCPEIGMLEFRLLQ